MKRAILVALGTGAVISSAAALGIGAVYNTSSRSMSDAEYAQALASIAAARARALALCDERPGRAADACRVEANANEAVQAADLEAIYRRTEPSTRAALRARIDARHQIARAKCEELGGYNRDKCLISAHAAKGRALLDTQAPYQMRVRS